MKQTTMPPDAPNGATSIAEINRDGLIARDAVTALSALPLRQWHRAVAERPEWMTLSTMRDLLAAAHDDLDGNPKRSARIAKFVLDVLPRIAVSADAMLAYRKIEGTAWKEYGNALRMAGQQRRALTAANHAISLFSATPLVVERAAATILKAHTLHELSRSGEALRLLDEAAATFTARGEERRSLQTLNLRGIILFECHQYKEAGAAFEAGFTIAQRLRDRRELARLYNNRGYCALQKGDLVSAWDLLVQAAALFAEQGMDAELPRAHWGLARLMREDAATGETVADLRRIYDVFTRHGMVVEAATVLLEIATTLAAEPNQHDHVRTLCVQLVALFEQAQMPPDAIAALAHLRHDALAEADMLGSGITHVRNYFRQLHTHAPFVPGH